MNTGCTTKTVKMKTAGLPLCLEDGNVRFHFLGNDSDSININAASFFTSF